MKPEELNIPADKFVFAHKNTNLHDKELSTKPVGYFKDAWNRFKKNKASIVAAIIIGLCVLFAIFTPFCTKYKDTDTDGYMTFCSPKNDLFVSWGWDIWDGCEVKDNVNFRTFSRNYAIGLETGHNVIKNQKYTTNTITEYDSDGNPYETTKYSYRFDTYQRWGVMFMNLTEEEYFAIQEYQNKTNIQIIYPYTVKGSRPEAIQDSEDANYWYKTEYIKGKTEPVLDENGNYINIYSSTRAGADNYNSIRIASDTNTERPYRYAMPKQGGTYEVRINYYEYYIFNHDRLGDGIGAPSFLFGSNDLGKDILTCLASGARFSLTFAICVALVNLIIGAIYGAIEGYYGGKIDLVLERIVEILNDVPFIVVITLLKYHMDAPQEMILFVAFFLTGWIGMAGRTRMQFYRFKNQEYVLAARTLGAKDSRIMFKHIFPNSLGTLITGSVLVIPGMIFSEASLGYLGILHMNASVGDMLATAQGYLTTYPHMMIFPAVFICLLMLSFNLFGNGLRDAFNPSLRGTEE